MRQVAIMICVDRAGDVKRAEIIPEQTEGTNSKALERAKKAALGYKIQPDPTAPEEQCGKLIFKLESQR